jgi:two-component system sensor histidine kinase KdpD
MTAEQDEFHRHNMIIACVEDHPKAMVLLRAARNRAQDVAGKWSAVFIETPSHVRLAQSDSQERMLRLLTLAQQMGGNGIHMEAETIEKGVIQLLEAQKDRVVQLIVGSVEPGKWRRLRSSAWERITKLARKRHVAVEIIPLSGHQYHRSLRERFRFLSLRDIACAMLAVALALGGALVLEWILPPALFRINNQNVGLLFMTACAFAAGRFGLLPGLMASAASFLIVNYYFTIPYHSLKFDNVTDTLNMPLFLSAAVLISLFTSQTRGYARKAAERELSTQALFTLYRVISVTSSRQQALETLQSKLTDMLKMDVAFFLPPALNPDLIEPAYPANMELDKADREALNLCWKEMKTTGLASPSEFGTPWRFEPMLAPSGEIGVLGIRPHEKARLDSWFGRLLSAIADQTATVIEHIELERSMEATRIREEREKLRSMLLSSVSHDLKTPLASIIGALSICRTQHTQLSPAKRDILIETALEETERLDSFITNILNMTRLESGKIEFRKEWHNAQDIVHEVVKRLQYRIRQHKIIVHPPLMPAEVYMDLVMTEQVLQNILDNACKYTHPGTLIEIRCSESKGGGFFWEVHDHGAGLPPEKMDRVFDKYARLQMKDSQVAGTGLGLAICKAIMEAQGGGVTAANHPDGGAVFTLYLPQRRAISLQQVAI